MNALDNENSVCQPIKLHVNSAGVSGVDRMSSFIAQYWEHFKDKSSVILVPLLNLNYKMSMKTSAKFGKINRLSFHVCIHYSLEAEICQFDRR